MNRTSTIERLYFLGDFQNIKITDTISDIPEKVFLDKEAMELLINLQILTIEHSYAKYLKLKSSLPNADYDKLEAILKDIKDKTIKQINIQTGDKE